MSRAMKVVVTNQGQSLCLESKPVKDGRRLEAYLTDVTVII